jgi:NitT/TauT family transport system substrate-binding protein
MLARFIASRGLPPVSRARLFRTVTLLAVVLLASAIPGSLAAPDASAQGPTIIRISFQPISISSPLQIAQAKGYFEKAGINVEMVELWQASEQIAGFASGQLDASASGIGPALISAISRGLDVKIVAPLHSERPPVATPLVVSKRLWDSGAVRSVADLKGRTVGLNSRGSPIEYWLHAALATGGLTPNDVNLVVLPFPDAAAAMANGALDASLLGEPVVTRAVQDGIVVRLTDDFVDDFQVTAVYFDTEFATQNRPAVEAFLAAYIQGARDLQGDGYRAPENLAILEKFSKVPAATIAAGHLPYHDPDGQVHVQDFQKLQDFFVSTGAVQTPIDIGAVIDLTYAEAARGLLSDGILMR